MSDRKALGTTRDTETSARPRLVAERSTAGRPRRIALWAVPRSVSTAFERVFIERDDAHVLHEPFSHAYYHGPERRSARFTVLEARPEHAYAAVMAQALGSCEAPILFLKDMAYQALPIADMDFFARLTNTFLIREPERALRSLHRMWPDFTFEEAGYAAQAQLFDLVTETLHQPSVVVDASDLQRDPNGIIAAYCAAVGIAHCKDALTWNAGPVPQWRSWSGWHRDAEQSRAITRPTPPPLDALPARVKRAAARCRPYYEHLHAQRLII